MSTTAPVTLFFEGVLIGRYDKKKELYEMGVLPVPNHSFSIAIEERGSLGVHTSRIIFEKEIPNNQRAWRLEVTGRSPGAYPYILKGDPPNRTKLPGPGPYDPEMKLDHRWVLYLEGRDFPNHLPKGSTELPRYSGLLRPVIQITTGEFYAKRLITDDNRRPLWRRQAKGKWELLGYVPRQVLADVKLADDREIFLKIDGTNEEIFRLRKRPGVTYKIFFRNEPLNESAQYDEAMPESPTNGGQVDFNRPSHFQMLYLLFGLPPDRRYECRHIIQSEDLPPDEVPEDLDKRNEITMEEINALLDMRKRAGVGYGVPSPRCSPTGTTSTKSLLE
jgi:hypothetical protein